MHMLLQTPNTHLSLPPLIPTPVLSVTYLISCLHYAACPIPVLPSSVRAVPLPDSLGNLEAASTNTDDGQQSQHLTYGLFYSISSSVPPQKPLLPRNHKPQLKEAQRFELPFQPSRPGGAASSSHPPYEPLFQLQARGAPLHISSSGASRGLYRNEE